jgi:hypothetical protein
MVFLADSIMAVFGSLVKVPANGTKPLVAAFG